MGVRARLRARVSVCVCLCARGVTVINCMWLKPWAQFPAQKGNLSSLHF